MRRGRGARRLSGPRRRLRRNRLHQTAQNRARSRLKHFRQSTLVSVALTGLLLLLFSPGEAGVAQDPAAGAAADAAADTTAADTLSQLPDTVSIIQQVPLEELQAAAGAAVGADTAVEADSLARQGTEEAAQTLRDLWLDFYGMLPKLGIALGILLLAGLLVRLTRPLLRRLLGSWTRGNAATALFGVAVWLLAVGISISVLTGDIRALVGSLGLVGLALSWALQSPIESFTGWLLNSFQGYYRVGDRIAVGEIYGDVYQIDLLNTTVWEYGGADRPGLQVHGEQATGRLITFPNNEILTGSIVNLTRDFPYVWDEVSLDFSTNSDIPYLIDLMRRVADEVMGDEMAGPVKEYEQILVREGLEPWVAEGPQVYVSVSEEGWLRVTIRYLVGARERRRWESRLIERILIELQAPEAQERVKGAFPRRLVQVLDEQGKPADPWTSDGTSDARRGA